MGGCNGLVRTVFVTFPTLGGHGGPKRTGSEQLILWKGLVVLKETIFNG